MRSSAKEKTIVVLGSKGMLGQMVMWYFQKQGYATIGLPDRLDKHIQNDHFRKLATITDAVFINCIGLIKQKSNEPIPLYITNTIIPVRIAEAMLPSQLMIHPSTDCVFAGDGTGDYSKDDASGKIDDYGMSKRIADESLRGKMNVLIVRSSIIGPDTNSNAKGLLSWVLRTRSHETVPGFRNHIWNGVTTLEWCKQIESLIQSNSWRQRGDNLVQLGTKESVTKAELINKIRDIFALDINVEETDAPVTIDRTLKCDIECKPIGEQLGELKDTVFDLKEWDGAFKKSA